MRGFSIQIKPYCLQYKISPLHLVYWITIVLNSVTIDIVNYFVVYIRVFITVDNQPYSFSLKLVLDQNVLYLF